MDREISYDSLNKTLATAARSNNIELVLEALMHIDVNSSIGRRAYLDRLRNGSEVPLVTQSRIDNKICIIIQTDSIPNPAVREGITRLIERYFQNEIPTERFEKYLGEKYKKVGSSIGILV